MRSPEPTPPPTCTFSKEAAAGESERAPLYYGKLKKDTQNQKNQAMEKEGELGEES